MDEITKRQIDQVDEAIKLLAMRAPKLRELIRLAGVHTQAAAA